MDLKSVSLNLMYSQQQKLLDFRSQNQITHLLQELNKVLNLLNVCH